MDICDTVTFIERVDEQEARTQRANTAASARQSG